jgi:hypothetical protein
MPPNVSSLFSNTKRWFSKQRSPPAATRPDDNQQERTDASKSFMLAPTYGGLMLNDRPFCECAGCHRQWWSVQAEPNKQLCEQYHLNQKRRRVFLPLPIEAL